MKTLTLCLALALPSSVWAGLSLENQDWRVELDPATLALSVRAGDGPARQLTAAGDAHAVSALKQAGPSASWQWGEGQLSWTASLQGHDLLLSARAKAPGEWTLLRQPAAAMGKGLMLPLAEGSYIPAGPSPWREFLPEDAGKGYDTSQNLSLPLWGMNYGASSLHWLLLNPFNNRLAFTAEEQGLALMLSHEFTPLNLDQPMTLLLHLGDGNPLSGAQRYKQWLQAEGRYQTLADKIAKQPDTAKLLGASHVYLWGNDLLAESDVRDWPSLLRALRGGDPLAVKLRGRFDAESQSVLRAAAAQPDRYQRRKLIEALNQAMTAEARSSWQGGQPQWRNLAASYHGLREDALKLFGPALAAPDNWGGGLSTKTIAALEQAGLKRLWLGVDSWEGGLWQPQAVAAGARAGYLMGAYDSYQTALKPGERRDWVTAQQGEEVYRQCGITLRNGKKKTGFQQSGYYTNPDCVRATLQARVQALQTATGFNSWFLDAYATGMTFDDYTPGRQTSQARMAQGFEASMQWTRDVLKLPVGSENGNATTSLGIAFAHGMQVPVLGWGDPDLQKNQKSPYFLGRWYPADQPETFFKSVPLKEPYRSLFYAAPYRLPLYQTVFHGSIVTTNHWLYDNLKFSNAYADNLLAQWLYNVPPLFHLSAASLKARLPRLQCADRAFRPAHEQLATKVLTGFVWLNAERTLQQTRFEDGSRLTANFGAEPAPYGERILPPQSLWLELAGQPGRLLRAADCAGA
ncbi:glycoside hydrolase [Chromobacterium sp. IIBBL 290-4]|uniref:glycoside hydrolase n=1 Tax=Chromobacterium sp. IIBBL 290-4 TaxID=2953890 RepID=UPI0020B78BF8|nr:glycoside hydrolase [Chromobacterium sp. IIBBL 290-4]UTH74701.1 glycoside hydrolase [Chromobacterium sp. IIBBL 290-4]